MDRLDLLFDRHLDGALSAGEEAELTSLLALPEGQRRWRELAALEGKLLEEHQAAPEAAAEGTPKRPRRFLRRSLHRFRTTGRPQVAVWIAVAGLCASALILLGILSRPARPAAPGRVEARNQESAPPIQEATPAPQPPPSLPKPAPLPPLPPVPEPNVAPSPLEVPVPPSPPRPPGPPAPEPPSPPAPSRPSVAPTVTAVARLERVAGKVRLTKSNILAAEGHLLAADDEIETIGIRSAAAVVFTDGTRLELSGNARLSGISDSPAKSATLERGLLSADVARQPEGRAMRLRTPNSETRVLGTRFSLDASAGETVLEVSEGRVQITRTADGASTEVRARFFAVVAAGPAPSAVPVPSLPLILSFTLIHANTGLPVPGFDPIREGSEVKLAKLPSRNLNIRANVFPRRVGSVRFALDGKDWDRIEEGTSGALYSLAGDMDGRYNSWTPDPGVHTVSATPYSAAGAKGAAGASKKVTFKVVAN